MVEVTVILVTLLCWWLYDGNCFQMLVAESLCWRLFLLCWWFSQCIKSATNISNLSPTNLVSNIRHQHRCNPWFIICLTLLFYRAIECGLFFLSENDASSVPKIRFFKKIPKSWYNNSRWIFCPEMTLPDVPKHIWIFCPKMTLAQIPGFRV